MDNDVESVFGGASARRWPTAAQECDKITAPVME